MKTSRNIRALYLGTVRLSDNLIKKILLQINLNMI